MDQLLAEQLPAAYGRLLRDRRQPARSPRKRRASPPACGMRIGRAATRIPAPSRRFLLRLSRRLPMGPSAFRSPALWTGRMSPAQRVTRFRSGLPAARAWSISSPRPSSHTQPWTRTRCTTGALRRRTSPGSSVTTQRAGPSRPSRIILAAPALQAPTNGATCQAISGTLDWADVTDASAYRVQIGTVPSAGTEYDVISSTYAYSGLDAGTTYYWRVKTKNACGAYGTYSNSFSFTTDGPLAAPTLLSPADGATDQPTSSTLDWADVVGATAYTVQIGAACGTGAETERATSETAVSGLNAGDTYFWRVKTKNACGTYGCYSACFSFTTAAMTGACCNTATGACTITTQAACSFTWLGADVPCNVTNCPVPPPTGACCNTATGACTITTAGRVRLHVARRGRAVQRRRTARFLRRRVLAATPRRAPARSRPRPRAASRGSAPTCRATSRPARFLRRRAPAATRRRVPARSRPQAACTFTWLGAGVPCNVTTCPVPPPTGACCDTATGACTITTQAACTFTWLGADVPCNATTCPVPPPTGACCDTATGACTITTQAACSFTWLGADVPCNATTCPVPPPTGACCNTATGACTITTAGRLHLHLARRGRAVQRHELPGSSADGRLLQHRDRCLHDHDRRPRAASPGSARTCRATPRPARCLPPTGACCNTATGACTITTAGRVRLHLARRRRAVQRHDLPGSSADRRLLQHRDRRLHDHDRRPRAPSRGSARTCRATSRPARFLRRRAPAATPRRAPARSRPQAACGFTWLGADVRVQRRAPARRLPQTASSRSSSRRAARICWPGMSTASSGPRRGAARTSDRASSQRGPLPDHRFRVRRTLEATHGLRLSATATTWATRSASRISRRELSPSR